MCCKKEHIWFKMYHTMTHVEPKKSNLDSNVVDEIINMLNQKHGREDPLTVTQGKCMNTS